MNGLPQRGNLSDLEVGRKTKRVTPRGSDGVAGEKTAEIEDVQHIVEVLPIGLNPYVQTLGLVNIRPRRRIHLKCRKDAATVEVDAVHHLLAVYLDYAGDALGLSFPVRALEIEREARVVLNAGSDPKARSDLITHSAANGVALILRVGEMACGGYHRVIAEKQAARHRKPSIPDRVGIAQEARKVVPIGNSELRFRAINNGLAERNRKTDGRVVDLIVVGIVGNEPAKIIGVELKLSEESLGHSHLVVVSF